MSSLCNVELKQQPILPPNNEELENNVNSKESFLKEAYRTQDYAAVANLINQGANPEMLVFINKDRVLSIFTKLFATLFNFENKLDLINICLGEDLSFDINRAKDQLDFEEPDIESIEILKNFELIFKFLQNLPLPILAILEGQQEVVDAIVSSGLNFHNMSLTYSVENLDLKLFHEGCEYPIEKIAFKPDDFLQLAVIAQTLNDDQVTSLFNKFGIQIQLEPIPEENPAPIGPEENLKV